MMSPQPPDPLVFPFGKPRRGKLQAITVTHALFLQRFHRGLLKHALVAQQFLWSEVWCKEEGKGHWSQQAIRTEF